MTNRAPLSAKIPVCVFAKPPRPGEVKTRLAETVGPHGASELARAFLIDTWNSLRQLPWAEPILATPHPRPEHFPFLPEPMLWDQGDGSLDLRIERVLQRALVDAPAAIAIGSDTPGLPSSLLEAARARLEDHDAVLGPSDDGGFYLLGVTRWTEGMLRGVSWSTASVFEQTEQRLSAHRFTMATLSRWFDVDRPQDLARLAHDIEEGHVIAEQTRSWLSSRPPKRLDHEP